MNKEEDSLLEVVLSKEQVQLIQTKAILSIRLQEALERYCRTLTPEKAVYLSESDKIIINIRGEKFHPEKK